MLGMILELGRFGSVSGSPTVRSLVDVGWPYVRGRWTRNVLYASLLHPHMATGQYKLRVASWQNLLGRKADGTFILKRG